MYRITYIHKDTTTELPLYIPGDQEYCLTDCTLELEMGKAGELNVYIPEDNPAREDIECLTDEIVVYRDDVEIWRGRPVTIQIDFDLTGQLTCEGILSYLYDTYYEPFEFQGSPAQLFAAIIENHNSHVEARKQFKIGEVTVEDDNDYINRSSIYYSRSLEVMTDKLINDSLGGYFRVRVESDGRYVDYLKDYDSTASQVVEYGSNILDIAEEVEYASLATVILPLGARLTDEEGMETDEYTTIASVNGGSIYYQDDNAVNTYGWICVSAEWEDVTEPSNLLSKAIDYLKQVTNAVSSFEINAVDLSLISDEQPINLGDYVMIRSSKHGINQYVELTKMTIHPLAPENDMLQFGADSASITGSQRNTERAVQSALGSLSMRVTNLTADVINAVYGNIENIIAQTVDTDYIEARIANLGYATIQYLESNYIDANTIEANYIAVNSEWVVNLDAWTANINSLLSGSVGTGELQTIHLTADNVVIDDAVIFDLIATNAIIGELMAGIIYTDFVKIANNEGQNLYIDGSTIQIYDGSYIRIQIGEDGDGDYNMYIWDANGNLLWDALGLTEAGLSGNGAIIKDMNIADDAAIQGYKIDMETLSYCLNEYGGLTMEAAQITIDGNTLEYKLSTMTTELDQISQALEGIEMEGVVDIQVYYALGDSSTEPPEDSEETKSAICGTFLCGELLCGATGTGSVWTLEEPEAGEGEYVWFRHRVEYVDGTVIWTTPTCITSGYMMTHLYSLQTQLEVVQGQISATVTRSDVYQIINESLEEGIDVNALLPRNYCLLSGGYTVDDDVDTIVDVAVNAGTLNESSWNNYYVINMYDGYMRIRSNDASCTFQTIWGVSPSFVEGETYTISVKCRTNVGNIQFGVYWFYLPTNDDADEDIWGYWNVGNLTATSTWQTLTLTVTAYEWENYELSGFMLGFGPLAVYGAVDIESIMVEKGDTAHDWTRAPEDYATKSQITVLQDQYSGIVITIDSIQQLVADVTTVVGDNFEYFETKYAEILVTEDEIRQTVSDTQQLIADLDSSTSTHFSQVEQTADEIKQSVTAVETTVKTVQTDLDSLETDVKNQLASLGVDISGLSDSITAISTQVTSNTSRIDQLSDEIVLEVRQATTELTEYIDSETGEILGTVEKTTSEIYTRIDQLAGSITISARNASLGQTAQIVVSVDGAETAASLDLTEVRNAFANDHTAITISAGAITFASGMLIVTSNQFTLDASGNATFSGTLSAPDGNIGGWIITTTALYKRSSYSTGTSATVYEGYMQAPSSPTENTYFLRAGYADWDGSAFGTWTYPFYVTYGGRLIASSATITGTIRATAGYIGDSSSGWQIASTSIYNGCSSMSSTTAGTYIGTSGIRQYASGGNYLNITSARLENGNSDGNIAALYSGGLYFTNGGTELGSHDTARYVNEPSKYGMTIHAEYDCKYIGFGHKESSSATTYTWDYLINYGLSTGSSYIGYSQKHILYGDVRVAGNLYANSVYFRSASTGTDAYYINTATVDGTLRGLYTNGYLTVASRLTCGDTTVYSYALSVNGSAYATGTFYNGSDLSLKTDVKCIDDDADTMLDTLEPVSYRYKDDDKRMHFGVTYQNVVAALEAAGLDPDDTAIVSTAKNEETGEESGAVAYSELIGLLIYEVKQLKQKVKQMGG